MKRIYVAGAYSADNVIDVMNNVARGQKACADILAEGYAPFCPWLDYQFQFHRQDLTLEHYYNYSMAWLEVANEVWVLEGWEHSKGTIAEIKRARELGIPVKLY